MFLSINISVKEFNELVDEYYNVLALHKNDIIDVKEYLITYMDPNHKLNERCFSHIHESMYLKDSNIMIKEYIESLDNYSDDVCVSVPVHNLNFIKKFIQNDPSDYLIKFINEMISYVNMEYNDRYGMLNYDTIDIRELCDAFGKNVFWESK